MYGYNYEGYDEKHDVDDNYDDYSEYNDDNDNGDDDDNYDADNTADVILGIILKDMIMSMMMIIRMMKSQL